MRPFLMLLLAARLYAANCGGVVTLENGQPAPGARVLFVPFDSAGRTLFTSTGADGGWSCPATVAAGRYLVSALGSQLTAGQKYDLTINADGTVRANVPGVEATSLSFRLVSEASGESKKSAPLASPDQKAPARAGDITPMTATIEKIPNPTPPPRAAFASTIIRESSNCS